MILPNFGRVTLRPRNDKRPTEDGPQDDYPTEPKQRKLDDGPDVGLMEVLDAAEEKTLHVASENYYMRMITCEEEVDVSYLESGRAADISDAIVCTNVGEIRHLMDRQLGQCMLSELCDDESPDVSVRVHPKGRIVGEEVGAYAQTGFCQTGFT